MSIKLSPKNSAAIDTVIETHNLRTVSRVTGKDYLSAYGEYLDIMKKRRGKKYPYADFKAYVISKRSHHVQEEESNVIDFNQCQSHINLENLTLNDVRGIILDRFSKNLNDHDSIIVADALAHYCRDHDINSAYTNFESEIKSNMPNYEGDVKQLFDKGLEAIKETNAEILAKNTKKRKYLHSLAHSARPKKLSRREVRLPAKGSYTSKPPFSKVELPLEDEIYLRKRARRKRIGIFA